jgi:hypothetical protein
MIPLDPGRRLFSQKGIKGGHYDRELQDFVNRHPRYVIVKEAEKVKKGVIYRKYSQYRWAGSGSKPGPHDKRFPKPGDALAGTYHSDWLLAKKGGTPLPKTTFSSLQDFLLVVDEVWIEWYSATPIHIRRHVTEFIHFSTSVGILLTVFFRYIPPNHFHLRTAFVEASWF